MLPGDMKDITKKNVLCPQIFAVGDVSFEGKLSVSPDPLVFGDLERYIKGCDICIANLENPLTTSSNGIVGKCTLHGDPGWAEVLKKAGINLVSLANNHMMDYGEVGLLSTINSLELAGLSYVGAGRNITEACKPLFIDVVGKRLAFLARTSVIVSSPSYATESQAGVAYLDVSETIENIENSKKEADYVILVIHWGLEEYSYPSPKQRMLAKEFLTAGADLILGHHPHVLQGIENIDGRLVAYSLGNFLFDEIEWRFVDKEGQRQERVVNLSDQNRKAGMLKLVLTHRGVESYEFIPTHITPEGQIKIENTYERKREFNHLCSRLHWPGYSLLWRLYSLRQEWKVRLKPMTIGRLKWANLKKIRPKHFRELLGGLCRSSKIVSGNSTNPYE
jgi:hypothetical protein